MRGRLSCLPVPSTCTVPSVTCCGAGSLGLRDTHMEKAAALMSWATLTPLGTAWLEQGHFPGGQPLQTPLS